MRSSAVLSLLLISFSFMEPCVGFTFGHPVYKTVGQKKIPPRSSIIQTPSSSRLFQNHDSNDNDHALPSIPDKKLAIAFRMFTVTFALGTAAYALLNDTNEFYQNGNLVGLVDLLFIFLIVDQSIMKNFVEASSSQNDIWLDKGWDEAENEYRRKNAVDMARCLDTCPLASGTNVASPFS